MLNIYGGSETFVGSNDYGVANGSITIGDSEYAAIILNIENLTQLDVHLISINLTTFWDWKTYIAETTMNVTSDPSTGQSPP